jgi:hypothetical protein
VASPFNLQASTLQPDLNGMFGGATTSETVDSSVDAGVAGQSPEAQGVTTLANQGAVAQPQASMVLQAARLVAGQVTQELSSIDSAAAAVSQTADTSESSTAIANDASGATSPNDVAGALQASLAAKIQMDSAITPGNGDANQAALMSIQALKSIQAKDAGSLFGLSTDAGDAAKAAKTADTSSSSHDSDSAGQQSSIAQPVNGHTSAVEVKGNDVATFQPILVATQAGTGGTAAGHSSNGTTESTTHGGSGFDGMTAEGETGSQSAGTSGISVARLIQSIGETEMRVGMHSSEFGDISIRTAVSQQQMQAHISVDHNELGNALSAHIPSVQAKLDSDFGLHATIEVSQGGASFSSNGDRSQQQKPIVQSVETLEAPVALHNDMVSPGGIVAASGASRLDIRA